MLTKRLRKELQCLEKQPDEYIKLTANPDNIQMWRALIRAPSDSVYSGFMFDVSIDVGSDYPLTPPKMKFQTKIFHPNVLFETGEICLDILKKEWSPAWSLQSACRAIMSLLSDPAPDSPLNCDAGNMLRSGDKYAFNSLAKMYCEEFATLYNSERFR